MFRVITIAFLLLQSFMTFAQEENPKYWSGDVELGAVSTTGNTEQTSVKLRTDIQREKNQWINQFHFDTYSASEDGDDTADRLYTFYRLDYRLREDRGLYGRLAYEDDKFTGFKNQSDLTFGYNQTLFDRTNWSLKGDIGLGVRRSELDTGETNNEMLFTTAGYLDWQISENALFKQLLSFEIGEDLTITRSETSLEANIIGALAMKLALAVKNSSKAPEGKDETDTETTVTLVYKF
jgi:putative salt-induced outer membrane protein